MTNSGREILLQAIVTRLLDIDQGDGYNTTPQGVRRDELRSLGEVEPSEMPILFVVDGHESIANMCSRIAESDFDVWIHGQIEDASGTSAGINALLWDVKRALHLVAGLDAGPWESGQGQMTSAELADVEVYRGQARPTTWGLDVRLRIKYQEPLTLTVSPA